MATVVERDVVKGAPPPVAETQPATERGRLPLGPLKTIHVYWLAGMSCDGCTISVAGATNPGIEGLLAGVVPAMPRVILHHPVLSVEAGAEFVKSFSDAWEGKLGVPYVVVYEGSVADGRVFLGHGCRGRGGRKSTAGADRDLVAPPGSGSSRHHRHRNLRHMGRGPVGRGQSYRRHESHGLPRQGLPERLRSARDQHPGVRATGRQLHRD